MVVNISPLNYLRPHYWHYLLVNQNSAPPKNGIYQLPLEIVTPIWREELNHIYFRYYWVIILENPIGCSCLFVSQREIGARPNRTNVG